MSRWLILVGVALATSSFPSPADEPKPSILVVVRATAPKDPVKAGQPILITLTVKNDLPGPIELHAYAVEPNGWNGETAAVDLVDIYRVGDFTNRFLDKPKVDQPRTVVGPSRRVVEPGKSLDVRIDASKWRIRDGWQPGTYTVTALPSGATTQRPWYCGFCFWTERKKSPGSPFCCRTLYRLSATGTKLVLMRRTTWSSDNGPARSPKASCASWGFTVERKIW